MNRSKVMDYVNEELGHEMRQVHSLVELFVRDTADTLDENFQLAAEILEVFRRRAKEREKGRLEP